MLRDVVTPIGDLQVRAADAGSNVRWMTAEPRPDDEPLVDEELLATDGSDADDLDVDDDDDDFDDDGVELLPDEAGVSDPIGTARRRHGAAGAILAAGMFGLDQALWKKPREEVPVVVTANSDPTDIDAEGINLAVDEQTSVVAPPLERLEPTPPRRRGRRARRTS